MQLDSAVILAGTVRTRAMYADYLRWRGVDVREVYSAPALAAALADRRPDVVILEGRLDDPDPLELVRRIRSRPESFDVPIVVLSADLFRLTEEACSRVGCDAFLAVPCLPDALYEHVRAAAERRAELLSRGVNSWLFVRGLQSVRIVYPRRFDLAVYGPGRQRRYFSFASEDSRARFHQRLEETLEADDFRSMGHGVERRSEPRPAGAAS